jgi:hypothetical protein
VVKSLEKTAKEEALKTRAYLPQNVIDFKDYTNTNDTPSRAYTAFTIYIFTQSRMRLDFNAGASKFIFRGFRLTTKLSFSAILLGFEYLMSYTDLFPYLPFR